ncbi:PrpF domain-containing protein [Nakamurella flava]|nr:PrpF domain-containing protein [Nakamurella flava]
MSEIEVGTAEMAVPASWVRGGTSKCWIFQAEDIDALPVSRDEFLLRAFGSPDLRQIDGIGGATSTTSKAIVVESRRPGQSPDEIVYSFAQVSVDHPKVEWVSNCGNCATALALYVVQHRLVGLSEDATAFQMLNRPTGLVLQATVPTPDGQAPSQGDQLVRGVPFPGVPVDLGFTEATWSTHGALLPTGHPVDTLTVDGAELAVTMVDAGAPVAVVRADAIGLTGADDAAAVAERMPFFAELRRQAARAMGLPDDDQSVPKVGIVGPGTPGPAGPVTELNARMISMSAPHPAIGLTSAVALAAAATVPGTLVHDLAPAGASYRIGTLSGPISLVVSGIGTDHRVVEFRRNSRRIVDALVYIPADTVETEPAVPSAVVSPVPSSA